MILYLILYLILYYKYIYYNYNIYLDNMEINLINLNDFLRNIKDKNILKYDNLSDYPLILADAVNTDAADAVNTDAAVAADAADAVNTVAADAVNKKTNTKGLVINPKCVKLAKAMPATEVIPAISSLSKSNVVLISPIDKLKNKKHRQLKNKSESVITITDISFNMFKSDKNLQKGISTKFMVYPQNNSISNISHQYFGIVIDTVTKRPLSIPPTPFNKTTNSSTIKEIDKFLKDELYDIIKIEDGTIITIYSWIHPQNGVMWSMSSNHGYDVSSYKWMGRLTYAEVFHDLVNRLYPEFKTLTGMDILYINYKDEVKTYLTFTNLDTNYCYSMGFRHHNFHPLKIDKEKIWQIQHVDLSAPNPQIIYGGKFPPHILPEHEKYNYSYFSKDIITKSIIEIKCMASFTNACILINSNHLEKSIILDNDDANDANDINNIYFQYGFILRSKDRSKTGIYSDIIIKSILLKIIESLLYKYYSDYKLYVDHINRMEYIAMRAFLKTGRDDILTSHKQQFIALFPDWSERFFKFEILITSIVNKIKLKYNTVTQKTDAAKVAKVAKADVAKVAKVAKADVAKNMDKLVDNLYKIIKKDYGHITKDYDNIIRNYIINPEYTLIYLHLIK